MKTSIINGSEVLDYPWRFKSQSVYDYVASHKGVCALEHDGFVSYEEVTEWSHPYLLIERKQ
ncbi:hypothetical protein B6I61_14895 [Klebsiella pneumoniae]|nr:hypothetical protein B6I61_14895 [Klebsiella pneumoniae]